MREELGKKMGKEMEKCREGNGKGGEGEAAEGWEE